MPRSVSASVPLTARVSTFEFSICGASADWPAYKAPAAKSVIVTAIFTLRIFRHIFIFTSRELPIASPLTIHPSVPGSLLQNLHQEIVAFLRIHQRELGNGRLLQLRIFLAARNRHQGVRISLNEKRVEHGHLVIAVSFLGVEHGQGLPRVFRADQTKIVYGRAANFRVLFSLRGFREEL